MKLMRKKRSLLWWQLLTEAALTNFLIICVYLRSPARSCPRPPRLARPPSATPQANAGRAWLAGELAMAGGFICNLVIVIWDL